MTFYGCIGHWWTYTGKAEELCFEVGFETHKKVNIMDVMWPDRQ